MDNISFNEKPNWIKRCIRVQCVFNARVCQFVGPSTQNIFFYDISSGVPLDKIGAGPRVLEDFNIPHKWEK